MMNKPMPSLWLAKKNPVEYNIKIEKTGAKDFSLLLNETPLLILSVGKMQIGACAQPLNWSYQRFSSFRPPSDRGAWLYVYGNEESDYLGSLSASLRMRPLAGAC
jgi:hypothetical protein